MSTTVYYAHDDGTTTEYHYSTPPYQAIHAAFALSMGDPYSSQWRWTDHIKKSPYGWVAGNFWVQDEGLVGRPSRGGKAYETR